VWQRFRAQGAGFSERDWSIGSVDLSYGGCVESAAESETKKNNRNAETQKEGRRNVASSAHLLGFRDDHRDAPRAHVDLRVLGVYGVQQLELELVVVVRLRAV
jgi:hypothetical protein